MVFKSEMSFSAAQSPKEIVQWCKENDLDTAVFADENLIGVLEFYNNAKKEGIFPIIGLCKTIDDIEYLIVAKNYQGYSSLCQMESDKSYDRFYDDDNLVWIAIQAKNISAVPISSFAAKPLDPISAKVFAKLQTFPLRVANMLTEDKFYRLAAIKAIVEKKTLADIVAFHAIYPSLPMTKEESAPFRDFVRSVCVDNYQFGNPVPPDYKFAIEQCNELKIDHDGTIESAQKALFEYLCFNGAKNKLGHLPKHEKMRYFQRLKYEMEVISRMHFVGYMLIVWDFISYAKKRHIPVGPGRGSAAGSLVSYVMDITNIDPLKNGLLFERFLNPDRVSLPDIDVDFCQDRRDEVINYVRDKYGNDMVAQIITIGSAAAKAAVRDSARILQQPLYVSNRLAKSIPEKPGITLKDVEDMIDISNFTAEEQLVWEEAKRIEKIKKSYGVHAAGVVISNDPIKFRAPVYYVKDAKVVGYEGALLEAVNLVKYDFLGLKNLTIIDNAVKEIEKQFGDRIDINSLPTDDPEVYRLISSGFTKGLFQIESEGMSNLAKRLQPMNFEELTAMVALFRPGPMDAGMLDSFINRKFKREAIDYFYKEFESVLKPILEPTYGVIVYQEQVMQIVQEIAGFSLAKADMIRRAMGKKKKDEMERARKEFCNGAVQKGYKYEHAEDLFNKIEKFAGYGFNKSHSAAYSFITYQTAWLKKYYPTIFMSSLINGEVNSSANSKHEKIAEYITEAERMGIAVTPPDIMKSPVYFTANEQKKRIDFGLAAIKGIGNAAESFVETRDRYKEKYEHLLDFIEFLQKRNQALKQELQKAKRVISRKNSSPEEKKRAQELIDSLSVQIKETFSLDKRVYEAFVLSGSCDQYAERNWLMHYQKHILKGEPVKDTNKIDPMSEMEKMMHEVETLGYPAITNPLKEKEDGTAIIFEKSDKKGKNGTYISLVLFCKERSYDNRKSIFKFIHVTDFNRKSEQFPIGSIVNVHTQKKGKYINLVGMSAYKKQKKHNNIKHSLEYAQYAHQCDIAYKEVHAAEGFRILFKGDMF